MFLLYNILQSLLLIIAGPLLFVKAILTPKYRGRIFQRLGIGLVPLAVRPPGLAGQGRPRIWIHALSVGEVASARPLVLALRREMPGAELLFSATTRTGEALAAASLSAVVDHFVVYPLDCLPSVKRALSCYRPDIFILVETDFWPNFLRILQGRRIPALLVNGRFSEISAAWYRRFSPLFRQIFSSFHSLAMQTVEDACKMADLGVPANQVIILGNLKYDSVLPVYGPGALAHDRDFFGIPADALLLVAGSTHPGEEEIVYRAFRSVLKEIPKAFLVIAPRKAERGKAVAAMAKESELTAGLRSEPASDPCQVMVLDTIGELAGLYGLCEVAFVGGSLVRQGGHNPLEPASFGKPVLFGPHMDDFTEIAHDLLKEGGALTVKDAESLGRQWRGLLLDRDERQRVGDRAAGLVSRNRGVADRHVALVTTVLKEAAVW